MDVKLHCIYILFDSCIGEFELQMTDLFIAKLLITN